MSKLERYTTYLLLIITIGIAWNAQRNSRNIDSLEDITQETQSDVQHIEAFVDEIEQPPSEEEVALDQAIAMAVSVVPELRVILCESFPNTTPCREESGGG